MIADVLVFSKGKERKGLGDVLVVFRVNGLERQVM